MTWSFEFASKETFFSCNPVKEICPGESHWSPRPSRHSFWQTLQMRKRQGKILWNCWRLSQSSGNQRLLKTPHYPETAFQPPLVKFVSWQKNSSTLWWSHLSLNSSLVFTVDVSDKTFDDVSSSPWPQLSLWGTKSSGPVSVTDHFFLGPSLWPSL